MIGDKIKKGKTETCDNPIFIECIISQLDTFNVWHHRRSLPQKSDGLISLSINQTLIYKLEQGCERVSTLQLNVRNVKGKEAINVHKILYSSNIQAKLSNNGVQVTFLSKVH